MLPERTDDLFQKNTHFVHVQMHNIIKNFEYRPNDEQHHLHDDYKRLNLSE